MEPYSTTHTCVYRMSDTRRLVETDKAYMVRENVWVPKSQTYIKSVYEGCGCTMHYFMVRNFLAEKIMERIAQQEKYGKLNRLLAEFEKLQEEFKTPIARNQKPGGMLVFDEKRVLRRRIQDLESAWKRYYNEQIATEADPLLF